MAKISLNPSPTFKLVVDIPIAGAGVAPVEFVFKHRTKSGLEEMFSANSAQGEDLDQVDATMQIIAGWELDDDFSRDNVARLLDSYPGAAVALMVAYSSELHRFKRGN